MKTDELVLPPVHAHPGVTEAYAMKLRRLIDDMHRSVLYFVKAAYRKNPPVTLANDADPAAALLAEIASLGARWTKRFARASEELAAYFATAAATRTDARLRAILKRNGIAVDFRMTKAMRSVLKATIEQNVGLIKSIPQKYLADVQVMVTQSVQAGRDLKSLVDGLQASFGVTKRRAAFIALDQNNKATGAFNRARQIELGVEEAEWTHSHGGKTPRPTHVAAGARKQRYDVKKGWYDPDARGKGKGEWIIPGQLIKCRCTSRSIIKGFI